MKTSVLERFSRGVRAESASPVLAEAPAKDAGSTCAPGGFDPCIPSTCRNGVLWVGEVVGRCAGDGWHLFVQDAQWHLLHRRSRFCFRRVRLMLSAATLHLDLVEGL